MRKLKLQMQMTLDGFVAGPNGAMDWLTLNWDNELNDYVKEITDPVDCMVLGRKLAQGFIPYWASRPAGEDPLGIEKINNTLKVVFTKTLVRSEWDNTVLAKDDLVDEITGLKNQYGKDILAYGGVTFVSALVKYRLVDEFHLFINPVTLGSGMTIFKGFAGHQNLVLKRSLAFPCGIVLLCYEPKPAAHV